MNDSLPPLPEYEPRPDLWARIEADLTRHNAQSVAGVESILPDLPTYAPKPDLWESIQQELDTVPVRPLRTAPYPRWLWGGVSAAAVLLLVGGWLWLHPASTERVRMEYMIEQTTHPLPTGGPSTPPLVPKGAEAFIARQCAQQRVACGRPEVHELRNQLVELTAQQQRIARERHVFGDDPVLIQAQEKLDHQRAQVLNELITILRS